MQSRTRKFRKSFDNYEQAIQKQLNDDFQVHQYLNQNNLQGNNIDQYLKLYDSLLVTKNQKKKKLNCLQVNYVHMTSQNADVNLQASQVQTWGGAKQYFLNKYQETQIKMSNQVEVKNNLWKQILQTKKSLNLLKGDIGHLVSRNQSANLLQSKISKVKIVADDQLKRVSLAYVKDKDQIKTRGQMQKKFNKKLKNVSMFEDTTLHRLKRNYLDTMVKKKEIHDRLNYIQKVGASINQSGDKQRLKNQINRNTLEMYRNFQKLINLIKKIPQVQSQFGHSADQIHEMVNWLKDEQNYSQQLDQINFILFSSSNKQTNLSKSQSKSKTQTSQTILNINFQDLQIITQQKLQLFQQVIIKQYWRIMEQIQNEITVYDMQMKKSQQILVKLQKCDEEIQKIQTTLSNQIGMKYILTKEMRGQYAQKLRKFIHFLKTIFVLLEYIEKILNYSDIDVPIKKRFSTQSQSNFLCQDTNLDKQKNKPYSDCLKIPSASSKSLIPSDKSLSQTNKKYVSELYKIYCVLLKQDHQNYKIQHIKQSLFYDLQFDLNNWLKLIKQYYKNGKEVKKNYFANKIDLRQKNMKLKNQMSKIRDSRISQIKAPKIGVQTEQEQSNQIKEENQYNFENYKRHHTVYREDNLTRHHSHSCSSNSTQKRFIKTNQQQRSSANLSRCSSSKIINTKKLKNSSQHHKKALRIKFLQDVDKDYYKMLKSTLKMQKQNTRKNYQFLRTFKRAKYSSRDQILQQKRFQCSYSMLFASKKSQQVHNRAQQTGKKSIFYKNDNMQKRISKLQQSRKLLQSSKLIRSLNLSQSGIEPNEKVMKQLKQNVRKIKQKNQFIKNKHSLSIKMKDIINLI